jgi:hypothetical protein
MPNLFISYAAFQPHVVITHCGLLGGSLTLRAPEFVKTADRAERHFPGDIHWKQIVPDRKLQYEWRAPSAEKSKYGIDFSGEVSALNDEVIFDVTMSNISDRAHGGSIYLFCLQAGAISCLQDYEGNRTFVRLDDRWISVHELLQGQFASHRMCVFGREHGVMHNLMARLSDDHRWTVGIALNQAAGRVSCNLQLWPSCIHANPSWRELGPGERETAHGKVYILEGDLDALYDRYRHDFC